MGSSSSDKSHAAEERVAAPSPAAAPAAGASVAASPFERPLLVTPERGLTYASLRFFVTRAVISNHAQAHPSVDATMPAAADITLNVVNGSKDVVQIESGQWQLRLSDGTVYTQPYSERVEPRNTVERHLSFPVPAAAAWAGASLTLDEKDKEPSSMALDGPVSGPFAVQMASGAQATTASPRMKFTILSGTEDLDDIGERAPLGKRYLHLAVRITSDDAGTPDAFLPEFLRFSIDGAPYVAQHMSDNNILASRSSQDVTLSLLVPAAATKLELEVGKPEIQHTARIVLGPAPVKVS